MRTDSVKKYVIPNIPYLFILWACLKLGTAYRLAAGADFAHKLLGLGQTIGPAFADFAPGLAPFDWLVGIVGAAAFRLLIYGRAEKEAAGTGGKEKSPLRGIPQGPGGYAGGRGRQGEHRPSARTYGRAG